MIKMTPQVEAQCHFWRFPSASEFKQNCLNCTMQWLFIPFYVVRKIGCCALGSTYITSSLCVPSMETQLEPSQVNHFWRWFPALGANPGGCQTWTMTCPGSTTLKGRFYRDLDYKNRYGESISVIVTSFPSLLQWCPHPDAPSLYSPCTPPL